MLKQNQSRWNSDC